MYLNIGTPKSINFPFGHLKALIFHLEQMEKLMLLGVPVHVLKLIGVCICV